MDQLKPFLRTLRVQRFWFIAGGVLLAYMATWFMTTRAMRAETESRISALNSSFSKAQTVEGTVLHPNTASEQGMDQLINNYVDEVSAAWKEQFENQETSLVWPEAMRADFIRIVEELKPIESTVKFPSTPQEEPLSPNMRDRYRFFIDEELPKLADIIGARWSPSSQQQSGATTPSRARVTEEEKPVLVDWKPSNQKALQESRFSWPDNTPTTLEVLYAQEDLWVLQALLEIIAETNGKNIKGKYQAAVKEIEFIDIGHDAIGMAGQVSVLTGRGRRGQDPYSESGPSAAMDMSGMDMSDMENTTVPQGGGTTQAAALDPASNRYVDKDFTPLTAARLRGAYDSTNPDDAILAVAKRIPVRLRLKVDQRKINRLLANFANYKLQVEIRQVRVNTKSGSTFQGRRGGSGSSSMSGMSNMMGMMGGGGGGMMGSAPPADFGDDSDMQANIAEMMGGQGMGSSGGFNAGPKLQDASPWDLDVELYGIIYIYNPVDREKIGKKLGPVTSDGTTPTEAG